VEKSMAYQFSTASLISMMPSMWRALPYPLKKSEDWIHPFITRDYVNRKNWRKA
jgi:hypothetical protein